MTNTARDHLLPTLGVNEQHDLAQVQRLLQQGAIVKAQGPNGEEATLPDAVASVLAAVVEHLARNERVTLVTVEQALTTQEAADLLNVSRPHLIKLLEDGAMPYTKVGTHRRIRVADALAFKQERDKREKTGLAEIARLSQEMGLYDE